MEKGIVKKNKEVRLKMSLPIPEDIKIIKDIFVNNGYKLFVVGGAVRDNLLNHPIKDYDLVTEAFPDKVEEMMQKAGLRTIATGKDFGVINVFTKDNEFEIATFRSDGEYIDSRRPDSVVFSDINTDVKRRDLRINALYYDIDAGEIIDLVGGIEDIRNGVIRTVGEAKERFKEDPLRILRFCRFFARFGSELNPNVEAALIEDASLKGVSGERIRDEFLKGIKTAKSISHFLGIIDKFNLFEWIFPNLKINRSFIDEEVDILVIIATILKDNDINVLPKKLNELKFPSNDIKIITFLILLPQLNVETVFNMKKQQRNCKVSNEQILEFVRVNVLGVSTFFNNYLNFQLSISGQDVMDNFDIKGVEVGKMIKQLEIEKFKRLFA